MMMIMMMMMVMVMDDAMYAMCTTMRCMHVDIMRIYLLLSPYAP